MLNGTVLFVIMLYAALALWLLYRDGLIRKPWTAVLCAVLVAAALAARASVFDMQTGDYRDWLARWMSYYRENGGFRAFRELPPYCNYHVPYLYFLALFSYLRVPELYLIKLLSVLFDILLAWAVLKLCGRMTKNRGLRLCVFFAVLFWPTVFLNSAVWGQCDSIYVALALIGIWLALEGKPVLSMSMLAFSFAFKLQAVFFLPFLLFYYVWSRKFSLRFFLLALVPIVVFSLGALLQGRSFASLFSIYYDQIAVEDPRISWNYPSFWLLLVRNIPSDGSDHYQELHVLCLAVTVALLGFLMLRLIRREKLSSRTLLLTAALLMYTCVLFLPSMHDRYAYPAVIFTLMACFVEPRIVPAALGHVILETEMYGSGLLFKTPLPWEVMALINLACYLGIACLTARSAAKDDGTVFGFSAAG